MSDLDQSRAEATGKAAPDTEIKKIANAIWALWVAGSIADATDGDRALLGEDPLDAIYAYIQYKIKRMMRNPQNRASLHNTEVENLYSQTNKELSEIKKGKGGPKAAVLLPNLHCIDNVLYQYNFEYEIIYNITKNLIRLNLECKPRASVLNARKLTKHMYIKAGEYPIGHDKMQKIWIKNKQAAHLIFSCIQNNTKIDSLTKEKDNIAPHEYAKFLYKSRVRSSLILRTADAALRELRSLKPAHVESASKIFKFEEMQSPERSPLWAVPALKAFAAPSDAVLSLEPLSNEEKALIDEETGSGHRVAGGPRRQTASE